MQPIIDTLSKIQLSTGAHDTPDNDMCVMECVAYVAGEEHSDKPQCACEVVTQVAIYANDNYLPALGEGLARRVVELAGSKVDMEARIERTYFLVDQVVRSLLPAAFQATAPDIAAKLRALPVIDSHEKIPYLKLAQLDMESLQAPHDAALFAGEVREAIGALRMNQCGNAAFYMAQLLDYANANVDVLKLIDQLLAIGRKADAAPTPEMKLRIAMLATRFTLPVPA